MIPIDLKIRRGDLKPDLTIDLEDEGVLIPVTTATSVSVIGTRNGTLLFKRTVANDTDGVVLMEWETGDTSVPGTITCEVEIIWPGAKPQSIRVDGVVKVLPDLG